MIQTLQSGSHMAVQRIMAIVVAEEHAGHAWPVRRANLGRVQTSQGEQHIRTIRGREHERPKGGPLGRDQRADLGQETGHILCRHEQLADVHIDVDSLAKQEAAVQVTYDLVKSRTLENLVVGERTGESTLVLFRRPPHFIGHGTHQVRRHAVQNETCQLSVVRLDVLFGDRDTPQNVLWIRQTRIVLAVVQHQHGRRQFVRQPGIQQDRRRQPLEQPPLDHR
mmetsp:Transcript_4908/g.14229  ORF Transcript_4908/g.14229 Transcript_4908/m.14229 type:complete len:223 (+) Transcript_4908:1194-1862(+)